MLHSPFMKTRSFHQRRVTIKHIPTILKLTVNYFWKVCLCMLSKHWPFALPLPTDEPPPLPKLALGKRVVELPEVSDVKCQNHGDFHPNSAGLLLRNVTPKKECSACGRRFTQRDEYRVSVSLNLNFNFLIP